MTSPCGRWIIAFNGEVYNFEQLRREVGDRRSSPWNGHSDTEVILECILQDGFERAIPRFSGMFAIAAVDALEGRLWLASDRAGKKPLYFGWTAGVFAFGSELKALTVLGTMPPVSRTSVAMMLRYGYVPAPWSIREGISKMPPGSIASLDVRTSRPGAEVPVRAYWSMADVANAIAAGRSARRTDANGLEQVLESAVRRRLVSDVPVGAFLSGGVDSSVICALMVRAARGRVKTFSIGFEDPQLDESPHAATVASALGTDHVCHRISDSDMLAVVPSLATMFDEPFADSSQIPTCLVSRVARQHVTVALSGDAGDEVFGGYSRYRLGMKTWQLFARAPLPMRRALAATMDAFAPAIAGADRSLRLSSIPALGSVRPLLRTPRESASIIASPRFEDLYRRFMSTWDRPPVLGVSERDLPADPLLDSDIEGNAVGPRSWMMAIDFITYMHGDILVKVDRASMAESLEIRCPFLDPEVVAFAWSLPDHLRIGDAELKVALKNVARRLIPPEVVNRPKMGFGVPLARWLRGPLRAWAQDLLSPTVVRRQGLLDPGAVQASVGALMDGSDSEQGRVWAAATLSAWHERWKDE